MTDTPRPADEPIDAELVDDEELDDDEDDDEEDPFDLGNLLGGGGLDLGSLMEQATQMQQQMAEAQAAAATTVLEGVSGGGAVRVTVTGMGEFQSIHIDPGAVDPDDVAMLEDLVLAALRDATARIQELQSGAMPDLGGLMGGG
jgi:nucleoid-associated protein EbfC